MSHKEFHYSDNRTVGNLEYLAIIFKDATLNSPGIVALDRYCVPGRLDIYSFDYAPSISQGYGDRIRYFTDTALPLYKACAKIKRDLNKDRIVDMLLDACKQNPRCFGKCLLNNLLPEFGETKSYTAIKEYYSQVMRKESVQA